MNNTIVYLIQSDELLNHHVSHVIRPVYHEWTEEDVVTLYATMAANQKPIPKWLSKNIPWLHRFFVKSQYSADITDLVQSIEKKRPIIIDDGDQETEPLPLMVWIDREAKRADAQSDAGDADDIREQMFEYVVDEAPGIYGLTTFEAAWALAFDYELMKEHLPTLYHSRFDRLCRKPGATLPDGIESPLTTLDKTGTTWTFFTKQEILDLAPAVEAGLHRRETDSIDYEWKDILTAHQKYEFDWVGFVYFD